MACEHYASLVYAITIKLNLNSHLIERQFYELAHLSGNTSSDDIVIRSILLEDEPHDFNIILCMSLIPFGRKVSEIEFILKSQCNFCSRTGNLPCDEGFAAIGLSWLKRIPLQANIS